MGQDFEYIVRKFPRLLRAMRFVACLSEREAQCALRDYLFSGWHWSGEAVNHYGGTLEVIKQAIKMRHHIPHQ